MKDYFDRILNRMQGDMVTDAKRNYYQGVIDSYFELGFLSEYERGELAIQLINYRLDTIRRNQEAIEQKENAILLRLNQKGDEELCRQLETRPC